MSNARVSKQTSDCNVYAVWATAWGPMAAAAGPRGLARVLLPHYQLSDLRELMAFEHPEATEDEAAFAECIQLSRAYFNGRPVSFESVQCDLPAASTFNGKILRTCRKIPYGQTAGYARVAAMAGVEGSARAAATALGRNPIPLIIPCHRVTYSDGRTGGFSAPGGPQQKLRMLALEAAG